MTNVQASSISLQDSSMILNTSSDSSTDLPNTVDAMEAYFECIATCSLEDGECVTRCVEVLREQS